MDPLLLLTGAAALLFVLDKQRASSSAPAAPRVISPQLPPLVPAAAPKPPPVTPKASRKAPKVPPKPKAKPTAPAPKQLTDAQRALDPRWDEPLPSGPVLVSIDPETQSQLDAAFGGSSSAAELADLRGDNAAPRDDGPIVIDFGDGAAVAPPRPAIHSAPPPKPAPKPVAKPKPAPKPAAKPKPAPKPVAKPKPAPKPVAKPKPAPKPVAKPKPAAAKRSAKDAALALKQYLASRGANLGSKSNPSPAVRDAQRDMGGITADGIYGPKTQQRGAALGVILPKR